MPIRPENRARYPKDWATRSYFVRFVRARGRCEWCGAVHGEPHHVHTLRAAITEIERLRLRLKLTECNAVKPNLPKVGD